MQVFSPVGDRRCGPPSHENTNTPGLWSGGVSARRAGLLRGVLGWYPLMPVLLHCILVIGGPQIGPESNGLGLRSSAPDNYAQGLGLDGQGNTAHGSAPDGRGNSYTRKSTVHAAGIDTVRSAPTTICGDLQQRGVSVGPVGSGSACVRRTQWFAEDQTVLPAPIGGSASAPEVLFPGPAGVQRTKRIGCERLAGR